MNQKVVSKEPDEETIRQVVTGLPPRKKVRLELRQSKGERLYVIGRPDKGFQLIWQDQAGNLQFSRQGDVDGETAVFMLTLYAQANPEWQALIDWLPPNTSQYVGKNPLLKAFSNMSPGMGALLIFGAAYTLFVLYAILVPQPGGFGQGFGFKEILGGFIFIGLLAAYIQYIEFFFSVLRPRMAAWLALRLGVEVQEDMSDSRWMGGAGPGTWEASGGSTGNRLLLNLFDIVILVVGLVGPVAVVGIGAFLLVERL
ncbi:MAG: hypothetical protein IAF02_23050 [Anaerolineae bacterium]|nr:hypothetical protein [Anaerolineae bacterium]